MKDTIYQMTLKYLKISFLGISSLLFLLCMGGLPRSVQAQVTLFADDAFVYLTVGSSEGGSALWAGLGALQEWDMEFGPGGCRVLCIAGLKHPLGARCSLRGQVLGAGDPAGCLGVGITRGFS